MNVSVSFAYCIPSSPPINQPQLQNHDVSSVLPLAMRLSTLRRITPNQISYLRITTSFGGASMAEETIKTSQSGGDTSSSSEKNVKVPEKLQSPPEKPLPDDCCGSGCVRCVWDIYYDELENYNKLISDAQKNKIDSDS